MGHCSVEMLHIPARYAEIICKKVLAPMDTCHSAGISISSRGISCTQPSRTWTQLPSCVRATLTDRLFPALKVWTPSLSLYGSALPVPNLAMSFSASKII